jgi:RNA polymerase sigma-70 factor, ECF subfamily
MLPPLDADLIARWHRGEPGAFEDLVRRWQEPVSRFLVRWVGEVETARDLCQEVFLRVHQAAPRYRENGAFTSWIYRIALNVVRDAARRSRKAPEILTAENGTASPGADSVFETKELAGIVRTAIAALPEPLRLVLVLRHYEQLSFEEIARLTQTPASTLKSRFAVALQKLRIRLEQQGWGPEDT